MSREWHERKYCSAENLWMWIDEQVGRNDRRLEVAKNCNCEDYKNLLVGRSEMLESLANWLHEEGAPLGEIAKLWGLGEKEEG